MNNEQTPTVNIENLSTTNGGESFVTVLVGNAPEPMPINIPQKLYLTGHIESPRNYIDKMDELLDHKKAIVTVKRQNLQIFLDTDPTDKLAASVIGTLDINPDLAKFMINQEKIFHLPELIKFLKMRKRFFDKSEDFTALLDKLMKYKGKVTTDYERERDNKGNAKTLLDKKIENELPENFVLSMPIFEREREITFKVDIVVDIREAEIDFWFESAELDELYEQERDAIMDKEVDLIKMKDYIVIEK